MAQNYSPKIITDGLVMCLDPSQNKSYPTTDLPVKNGLALWLDAADDTTFSYSSAAFVSQWRDKSGNNFHASQGTVASQPNRNTTQNSRKTVNFDGTNDTVTIPNFSCNSEMSIFVVSNCGTSLFIEHSTDTNSNSGFYLGGQGTGMFAINRSPGIIYINNANWLSGGYSIASGVNSTGLDLLTYKNGTQQSITFDGRASRTNSYTTATLYIGSRGANSIWSAGPIAEIIIYNRKVTNIERNSIHTYLGQKWGISNTDRSIIDLSGNNNHGLLGNGTSSAMPTFNYYNKSMTYNKGTANTLVVTNATSLKNNSTTIELYMKFNSSIAANTGDYIQMGIGSGVGQFYFRNENPNLTWNWYPASSASSNLSYAISNFSTDRYYLITLTGDSAGASKMYVDGVQVASAANVGSGITTWTTNNLTIGGYVWDGYSNSDIALTRIYNRVLSAVEISQNYEVIKSRFANTLVQQGLVFNIDAGNPYSYAGSGTVVYDVSVNTTNSGSLIGGTSYSTSNGGVFVFDGVDDYILTNYSQTTDNIQVTWEAWFWDNSAGFGANLNTAIISNYGPVGTTPFTLLHIYDNGYPFFAQRNSSGTESNATYSVNICDGIWHHLVGVVDGTNTLIYVDGVLRASQAKVTGTTTSGQNIVIGGNHLGRYQSCRMGSARIYNIALSATQVLQNYNATKARFGL